MRGLIIMEQPLKEILDGKKTWEIRGTATKIQERIALIQSKSGHVVGICDLVECEGPLTKVKMIANVRKHRIPKESLLRNGMPYPKAHAWVLRNARRLEKPIPYKHPPGAIIWVKLDGTTAGKHLARVVRAAVASEPSTRPRRLRAR